MAATEVSPSHGRGDTLALGGLQYPPNRLTIGTTATAAPKISAEALAPGLFRSDVPVR